MNDLIQTSVSSDFQTFKFNGAEIRIVVFNDEPFFVAKDVAQQLDYSRTRDMIRVLDDDEKGAHKVRTPGGDQEMQIISESGLYHAIFKSRKEEAKTFRKWITSEVLPEIRRTGGYRMEKLVAGYKHQIQAQYLKIQQLQERNEGLHGKLVIRLEADVERLQKTQKRPPRKVTDEERQQIISMFDSGVTKYRIGKELDRGHSVVDKVLQEHEAAQSQSDMFAGAKP